MRLLQTTRARSYTDLLDQAATAAKGKKGPTIKTKQTEYVVRTGFGDEEVTHPGQLKTHSLSVSVCIG